MVRKGIILFAVCLLPAMALADQRGPWELTLGGNAVNGRPFNGCRGGIAGSLGYFIGDNFELARAPERVNYSDSDGVSLNGGTDVAADFHMPIMGQFVLTSGPISATSYGESGFHDTFEAGPEGA